MTGYTSDDARNAKAVRGKEALISGDKSRVPVYVIPTNEELILERLQRIEERLDGVGRVEAQLLSETTAQKGFEQFQRLASDGRLLTYEYDGFWACMDTFKEKQLLEDMYSRGRTPWEVWKADEHDARNGRAPLTIAAGGR